jgi:hypothetical protein
MDNRIRLKGAHRIDGAKCHARTVNGLQDIAIQPAKLGASWWVKGQPADGEMDMS